MNKESVVPAECAPFSISRLIAMLTDSEQLQECPRDQFARGMNLERSNQEIERDLTAVSAWYRKTSADPEHVTNEPHISSEF